MTTPLTVSANSPFLISGRRTSRTACLKAGLWDLTDRQLQYSLEQAASRCQHLLPYFEQRFWKWDRRCNHYISFDDTPNRRYGQKVYAAARQYDHGRNGAYWGNTLVDGVISSNRLLALEFQAYLPRAYLERQGEPNPTVITKSQLMQTKAQHWRETLLVAGVPASKIWQTIDCWYASEEFTQEVRASGTNLLMGLKKNLLCNLFGTAVALDQVFAREQTWHYRTDPVSGTKVWFKTKVLNLFRHGRCRVFALRRGQEKRVRYYGTTHLKLSVEGLLGHLRAHWLVETLHEDVKQYFGLNGCYSGRQEMNEIHWTLSYCLVYLFRVLQTRLQAKGDRVTIHQLWDQYCFQYDAERAKKCFMTPQRRMKALRLLVGENC